jgi:hypothetical protein
MSFEVTESAVPALAHVQPGAGEAESIEPFLIGRARARAESFDDFIGHFVMMIADVMEDEVGSGVDDVVFAENPNFGIAEAFFVMMAGGGDKSSFVDDSGFGASPAIIGDGGKIGVRASAFPLAQVEMRAGDIRGIGS